MGGLAAREGVPHVLKTRPPVVPREIWRSRRTPFRSSIVGSSCAGPSATTVLPTCSRICSKTRRARQLARGAAHARQADGARELPRGADQEGRLVLVTCPLKTGRI